MNMQEAIALYLADKCSLGRAAELANVTRWEMIDMLKKRHIPIMVETDFTAAEMDAIEKELETGLAHGQTHLEPILQAIGLWFCVYCGHARLCRKPRQKQLSTK